LRMDKLNGCVDIQLDALSFGELSLF